MKKILFALICSVTLLTAPAYADNVGSWTKLDVKVPVHRFNDDVNLRLRMTPELAFTDDAGGLKQTVFRVGPSLKTAKWLTLTLNGVSSTTNAKQDLRPELQAEFYVKFADLSNLKLSDRNRGSYRTLDSAVHDRWQYANEYKVAVDIPDTKFNTFFSHELFLDFQYEKLTQHRLTGGFGRYLSDDWMMEAGYLYRTSMHSPEWIKDHMLFLAFSNK
jgi:hypothetical protein